MAQNPYPFGSSKYDEWNYTHGVTDSTDQLLADSKGTLASSGRFLDSVTPETEQDAPGQNGFLNDTSESVMDSPLTRLARLGKQIVRPIPRAIEGAAGVGSFLPGPVGAVSRGVLGAESGANLLAGGTERLSAHPIASGLDAAGVLAGLSSLKGLKALVTGASELAPAGEMADMLGGRALAYEGGAGVRPEGRPAVTAIQRLMKSPSFENLPQGDVAMSGRAPRSASSQLPPGGYHAQDVIGHPGAERYMAEQFARNKPVADEVFGKTRDLMGKPRGGKPSFTGRTPTQVDITRELEALSDTSMNPLDRLAARSAERFGKRFRKE